jgi:hypothetical protein
VNLNLKTLLNEFTIHVMIRHNFYKIIKIEKKVFKIGILIYLWSSALPEKLPIVQPFRKFAAILRNPKVHHRVHKSPPLVPIMSQFDPVHTIPSKIHFNIVHPPMSSSSHWSLSF